MMEFFTKSLYPSSERTYVCLSAQLRTTSPQYTYR